MLNDPSKRPRQLVQQSVEHMSKQMLKPFKEPQSEAKNVLLTIELNLTFLSTPRPRSNYLYLIGACFKSETIQFELLNLLLLFITSLMTNRIKTWQLATVGVCMKVRFRQQVVPYLKIKPDKSVTEYYGVQSENMFPAFHCVLVRFCFSPFLLAFPKLTHSWKEVTRPLFTILKIATRLLLQKKHQMHWINDSFACSQPIRLQYFFRHIIKC